MKLKHLYIDSFRSLKTVKLQDLDPRVNLFVGVNGAGKSSVLDAISLLMSWYVARIQNAKGRGKDIPKDDISLHATYGCTIELTFEDDTRWKLYRSLKYKKADKSDLTELNQKVASFREAIEVDSKTCLPVIAHYGVNRIVRDKYPRMPRGKQQEHVLDTYKNALKGGQLFSDFYRWFRLSEDYENEIYKETQKANTDPGLNAVRQAMHLVFPEYTQMKVGRRPNALYLVKGEERLKINQLSDGEKCYITLVCDLARRLAVANPVGNPLEGEGIVLIDEIDLHLHPLWQQTVISKLKDTFPNIQFFITTHSPIVASDVDGSVYVAKDGQLTPQRTYGKLSSNILSSVFEVSMARSLYVQRLLEAAYDSLDRNDMNHFYSNYAQLEDILGADDLDLVSLKIEQFRREKSRAK
ncbi:ATPase, partial [gut metagenome]